VANSRSARKRIRANEGKHLRNRAVRSAVRTKITKARRALLGIEAAAAEQHVAAAIRELDRAAEKGILHRNNAGRRKSRLMAMANKLAQAATAGADQAAARAAAAGGEKGRTTKPRKVAGGAAKGTAKTSAAKGSAARSPAPKTSKAPAKAPRGGTKKT